MNRHQPLDCLQFHNDLPVDQQINAIARIHCGATIDQRKLPLLGHFTPPLQEFECKAMLIG